MHTDRKKRPTHKKEPSKKKKITHTGQSIVDELKAKGNEFRKVEARSRRSLYASLQLVQEREVLLESNRELCNDFLAIIKSARTSTRIKADLKLELAVSFTGDTRQGRKLASEYCRALRILDLEDVKPKNIASVLKKRGGVKKIIAKDTATKKRARVVDDENEGAPKQKHPRANDVEVPCSILMPKSMFDGIDELARGSEITLKAMVIGQARAVLKARGIIGLSGDSGAEDDDDDDDDDDDGDDDDDLDERS